MMDCIQMRWLHVLGLLLACDIYVVGKRNGAFIIILVELVLMEF